MTRAPILPTELHTHIAKAIEQAGGWIGFDTFMALALYTPGLGYYANDSLKFGRMPVGVNVGVGAGGDTTEGQKGSDFVTAPELSPRFGQALARQVAQALEATGTHEVWEFGAGSGALAQQVLDAIGPQLERYTIVDISGSLMHRQRERLAAYGSKVQWAQELPLKMRGVVLGNEVLDAMPVRLLSRLGGVWHERGVALAPTLPTACGSLPPEGALFPWGGPAENTAPTPVAARTALESTALSFVFADQPTDLRPPVEIEGAHGYVTEIHLQAEGFIRTLADRLEAGAAFLLDYGFPEHEYYHPQRSMGTVMCHRGHRADGDALADVGTKDITAHVNFTGIALAAQDAGLAVLGYTSQGRFLLNCGVLDGLGEAGDSASLSARAMVQKLVNEHEMGELFKVIGLAPEKAGDIAWVPIGFATGDRTHRL